MSNEPSGRERRGLVARDERVVGQGDVERRGRLAQLDLQGGGPAQEAADLVDQRRDRGSGTSPSSGSPSSSSGQSTTSARG